MFFPGGVNSGINKRATVHQNRNRQAGAMVDWSGGRYWPWFFRVYPWNYKPIQGPCNQPAWRFSNTWGRTVTNEDFPRIPGIIKASDIAIIGAKRKKSLYIVYTQAEAGITYLYFEQILNSRKNKALRGSTFYKVTRPLTLTEILNNISRNNKTKVTDAKTYIAGKL